MDSPEIVVKMKRKSKKMKKNFAAFHSDKGLSGAMESYLKCLFQCQ